MTRADNFAEEELRQIEKVSKGFRVFFHYTDLEGMPKLSQIEQDSGLVQGNETIVICGPTGLREHLVKELRQRGVTTQQILTEDFNLI